VLVKVARTDAAAKKKLADSFELLAGVICKVIESAETWQQKKVKKTGLCVSLFAKAAKALLSAEVGVDVGKDVKKMIAETGAKLVRQIDQAIEKDKTMSNLKGKSKEIKRIMEL